MAIPPVSREHLLNALARFDAELRNAPAWRGWEARQSQLYAIEHDGKLYPVKRVISMATGVPVSGFKGGQPPNPANQYVIDRGFQITQLRQPGKRSPPWSRDELLLALDVYLRYRAALPGKQSRAVLELSELLNRLGAVLHGLQYETYRNPNGVYMKLMNFRAIDPEFPDRAGLPHGGQLESDVWAEFADDPDRCHYVAADIRANLRALDNQKRPLPEFDPEWGAEAKEGQLATRVHISRERDPRIVQRKKEAVLRQAGHLTCEVCDFVFVDTYGERGDGFIECHHVRPISESPAGTKTRLGDLRLVCSNCHRMIHRRRPWLTIEQLQALPGVRRMRHRQKINRDKGRAG